MEESEENIYPTLLVRIQSIFVDYVLILIAMLCIAGLIGDNDDTPGWVRGALFIGLVGVYEPLLTSLGGTLGNRIMGIKVRRDSDPNRSINIVQAYQRFVVKVLLGWLSFITIHMNPKRRAIHDLVSGSVMLYKNAVLLPNDSETINLP